MINLYLFTSSFKAHYRLPGLILPGLMLAGLLSTPAIAQADEVVFSGSGSTPWQLYLGSNSNRMVPVQGPETTS